MTELRLRGVSVTGADGAPRLDQVDLGLRTGECAALVGPNGAGKSTLLRAALGLEHTSAGRIEIDGVPSTELAPKQRAAHLAWLPQRSSIHAGVSCRDVVASARYRFDESHRTGLRRAEAALERVGLGSYAERPGNQLSGGEFQRLQVAALLSQEAPLLLLDEPATHLDPLQQHELYVLLGELWREGHGLLLVTHDVNLLRALNDPDAVRVVGLQRGRLRFECHLGDARLTDELSQLFGVPIRRVESEGTTWLLPHVATVDGS